ncbi:Y-family DNA polymerase [Marinobacterium jannaschii]|uniref:Y-family DNA polymerase n=1 Tax=Marinobacterium jannaschii TaxID=64970 RepID=UPI0006868BF0|nr:DNA polymerase Y family protein [Marinobacterium jannaschii]
MTVHKSSEAPLVAGAPSPSASLPSSESGGSLREPLWLCLHFPLLALEALQQDEGAAALLDHSGQRLALCNGRALAAGLEAGLASATAYSICPPLQLFKPQPERSRQQLENLALWAGNFSAQISPLPPDSLLLELGSMLHYFGGLECFNQQLNRQLLRLGYRVQRASGHTPLAAQLLARAGHPVLLQGREAHMQQLKQLSVSQLELKPRLAAQLQGMGIRQLGDLLALPREALVNRFSPPLLEYLDRLSGARPDPQPPYQFPPQFERRQEFNREIGSSQALLFPLKPLLEALQGYLRHQGLQALRLQLQLDYRDGAGPSLELGHSGGASAASDWLELCRLRLESLTLQQAVLGLRLRVVQFRELEATPSDLFSQRRGDSDPDQLFSRLRIRLGEQAVQPLALAADHRPEYGWSTDCTANVKLSSRHQGRPGWLLKQPQRIETALVKQRLTIIKGPERICGGWWDQQAVRRDYYVARWPDGRLGWLFRDDRDGWYLHGWYG